MESASGPVGLDKSSRTVVLVPARLASTRLPDKPLAAIAGEPMIVHVWRRAVAAGVGPVVVACAEEAIAAAEDASVSDATPAAATDLGAAEPPAAPPAEPPPPTT